TASRQSTWAATLDGAECMNTGKLQLRTLRGSKLPSEEIESTLNANRAILKMNNDLAVNIAQHEDFAAHYDRTAIPFDYFSMGRKAQEMLKKSLDALVNTDLRLAYEVLSQDDDVDAMKNG